MRAMQIRLPQLQLVLLFLALFFFKTPVGNFLATLDYFHTNSLSELWQRARNPNDVAGTADFASIVAALKKHSVAKYQITGALKDDAYFYQRTVEGAWPIRYRHDSDFVVGRFTEINAACRLLTEIRTTAYGELGLAHCRH